MNNKRKKSSRLRGSHTHKRGFKKKARGSGHRGGFGMAGTGKRADQRKTLVLNLKEKYFGRGSLKAKPEKLKIINVEDLENISKGKNEITLKNYKLLGRGEIKSGITININQASKSAIEKVEKAGGKVILPVKEKKIKEADKEIKKETEDNQEVEEETDKKEE